MQPHAVTLARELPDGLVLVNLSGRGDKDLEQVMAIAREGAR